METNNMNKLEAIHVRPLSSEERSRAWNNITAQLPSTPVLSPFVFPIRKAISFAAIFIFLVGTVSVSNSARPGQILFPLDTAVERIESSLNSSSQAEHAQERLAEFDEVVGNQPPQDVGATAPRMGKVAAPEADTMMFSVTNDVIAPSPLSDETEQAIITTRTELEKILNDAMLNDDTETVVKVMTTIDEFEAKVEMMRSN